MEWQGPGVEGLPCSRCRSQLRKGKPEERVVRQVYFGRCAGAGGGRTGTWGFCRYLGQR